MKNCISYLLLLVSFSANSQSEFYLPKDKKQQEVTFKRIHNLIIIPLEINGVMGSYILDTGFTSNVVFLKNFEGFKIIDTLRNINLQGLGMEKKISAIISQKNHFRIGDLQANNKTILLVNDSNVEFSEKIGENVNGVVGCDFFKDFVVKIDYKNSKITFIKHEFYREKKCRSYQKIPIEFKKNKPFITAKITLNKGEDSKNLNLLVDTGASDAIWLFDDYFKNDSVSKKNIVSYLGESITGSIYGKKARVSTFLLGDFLFKKPVISFMKKEDVLFGNKTEERDGTIGGGVLRKFTVWFNYQEKYMVLRNNLDFWKPVGYNMSGLEFEKDGEVLAYTASDGVKNDSSDFSVSSKPMYKVFDVRKNSPAANAGILVGDFILKINNISMEKYSVESIHDMFFTDKNKKIKIQVTRNGVISTHHFKLKDEL